MKKRPRPRHSAAEYFLAAVGVALIALVVAIVATSRSCRLRLSPELGMQPAGPPATPTASP
jgi:hypothetical protein